MKISASVAEKAIKHFELLEKKCDKKDLAQMQMAMIYRCAVESIKMMKNPKVKEVLKANDINFKIEIEYASLIFNYYG